MFRWLDSIFKQFVIAVSNFSDLLDLLLRIPFRSRDDDSGDRSRFVQLLLLPVHFGIFLVGFLGTVLLFPIRVLIEVARANRKDAALCLPAIISLVLVCFVVFQVLFRGGEIRNRYRAGGRQAIEAKDFELAKTFYGRILGMVSDPPDVDKLNWAVALDNTGNTVQAANVMDQLAPDDERGSEIGHRTKAVNIARRIGDAKDTELLEKLRWHLDNSGEANTLELNRAWAKYYLKVGQDENALPYMEAAAELNPEFLFVVADYKRSKGNVSGQVRALRAARQYFEKRVERKPTDHRSRVRLGNALVQLDQIDEAQRILLQGVELKDDKYIRHATADFFLMRHDLAAKTNFEDFDKQLKFLKQAIELDLNHPKTYERLISQFLVRTEGGGNAKIKELLEQMISEGKTSALGHFALSNILWIENNTTEAEWHIEQAYKLDEKMIVVANNLAWLLSHSKNPDLDRAYSLAVDVVKQDPNDARFRDTLATILLKQEKYEESLVEFQKALVSIKEKGPVHSKLSFIYKKLNKPRLAELHRQNAQKLSQ